MILMISNVLYIPSHEVLKLDKAEPSVAGAVVPEHKNAILLKLKEVSK